MSCDLLGSARAGGMCVVEVGSWRLLPSTTAPSFFSALGVLRRYLPTRRAVETRIGGSVGVASVPLNRRTSRVPTDSGSMVSLRRSPAMEPNSSSYWGGLLGTSLYSMVTRLYMA